MSCLRGRALRQAPALLCRPLLSLRPTPSYKRMTPGLQLSLPNGHSDLQRGVVINALRRASPGQPRRAQKKRVYEFTMLVASSVLFRSHPPDYATNHSEYFDTTNYNWGRTGNLNVKRVHHCVVPLAAVHLRDGRVLLTGGAIPTASGTGVTVRTELYNVSTGMWTRGPNMGTARQQHAILVLGDGKVLIAGGRTGKDAASTLPSAEVFDPAADTFTAVGNMVCSRFGNDFKLINLKPA